MKNPDFLKKKYSDLHTGEEVESAIWWAGEKPSQKPAERIQSFLNFFNNIVEAKDPAEKERGLNALKQILHDKFVIKEDEIPESYFKTQQRIARELGHGDVEISDKTKHEMSDIIIKDQLKSLDNWLDYFASPDAMYPDWLKYWAMRSIVNMGEYDKDKGAFTKRTKGMVKAFPDLDREALAYVLDAVEKKYQGTNINFGDIDDKEKEILTKLLKEESFVKLYGWAIANIEPISEDLLKKTEGQWVKYPKGSDHLPLTKSLQRRSTGWCTAGEGVAQSQLAGGDFYVYYSADKRGNFTIPRAAIRMEDDKIAEVRGRDKDQNLDPYIGDVVKKKMEEFPDGKEYDKKTDDMKKLTQIDNMIKAGQKLSKEDLIFLYEINSSIEGFGYEEDPRKKEIRNQRNPQEDAPIVFNCRPDQIAHNVKEINKDTKAYIGKLTPGIFEKLDKSIEHIYTSLPEGRIVQKEINIGGKTKDELKRILTKNGYIVSDWATEMMDNSVFKPAQKAEKIDLVILSVADLGFPHGGATTRSIYENAQELGLEIVPQEVGPQLRLQYEDQPMAVHLHIGSEPLAGSAGFPSVFDVNYYPEGRMLWEAYATPDAVWTSDSFWVFRRK